MKKSLLSLAFLLLISASPSWSMEAPHEDQEFSCLSSIIPFLWEDPQDDSDGDVSTTQDRPQGFREDEESPSFCRGLQEILASPAVFIDEAGADPEQYFSRLRTRGWELLTGDFLFEDTHSRSVHSLPEGERNQ